MTCSGSYAKRSLGVVVPEADAAAAVDLDDGDADPAVGDRECVHGEGGAGGAGAGRALGEVELEPDVLLCGGVLHAPAGGQRAAQQQAAAALAVGVDDGLAGVLERNLTLRVAVGDGDAHAAVRPQAQHIGGGAGVHHRIGDELTGQDDGVIDDVAVAPALKGVADERSGQWRQSARPARRLRRPAR